MQITPGGSVSLFAQNGLNGPVGLAFDSAANLYAANANNNTVVRFSPDGVGSVFASTGLNDPIGIAIQVPEPTVCALLGVSTVVLLGSRRKLKN
jgi:DNA-binding beta-propeller fold protein YncE